MNANKMTIEEMIKILEENGYFVKKRDVCKEKSIKMTKELESELFWHFGGSYTREKQKLRRNRKLLVREVYGYSSLGEIPNEQYEEIKKFLMKADADYCKAAGIRGRAMTQWRTKKS